MKKLLSVKKLLLLIPLVMLVAQFLLFVPKVDARAARCYMSTAMGSGTADCSSIMSIIAAGHQKNIFDENCYEITSNSPDFYIPIEKDCRQAPFNIADASVHTVQCSGEEPKQVPITQTSSQACGTDPDNTTNPGGNSPVPTTTPAGSEANPAATGSQSPAAAQDNSKESSSICNQDDPTKQLDPEKCIPRTGGGFEEVDTKCNVGNFAKDCAITDKLSAIANILAAGVGVVVVVMIIVGGVQYSAAGGDPQRVAAAKTKILNAIYALIAFFLLWAFLQWVVPGGLF